MAEHCYIDDDDDDDDDDEDDDDNDDDTAARFPHHAHSKRDHREHRAPSPLSAGLRPRCPHHALQHRLRGRLWCR